MYLTCRSSLVLHEGATLLDLRKKVQVSTGVPERLGLGHGSTIFLTSVLVDRSAPTPAGSPGDGPGRASDLSQRDVLTLQDVFAVVLKVVMMLPARWAFREQGPRKHQPKTAEAQ